MEFLVRAGLLVCLTALLLVLAPGGGAAPAAAEARSKLVTVKVGTRPRSDRAAAREVRRSRFEPRPENAAANRRMPTRGELADFRKRSDMPYARYVTGRYRGTTDEVIQWAAAKWGLAPDLLRAVATVESWWKMSTLGDGGDSFGLFQVRRPYHCCEDLARGSSAFNADYYGAIIRAFYDGKQGWLNTVERGREYRAGDLWGSVGVWASGRWHLGTSDEYVAKVKQRLREKTWRTDEWF